ncbi:STAS domain-containing protein [bacterium]|nr:STAS domain-containing protein [bacterium]
MKIISKRYNDVQVIQIDGVLNAQSVGELKKELDRIFESEISQVLLNLENLDEIDSSGIGAIVSLLKRMRLRKGDVKIIRLRGSVKKLFELLRLDRSMEVYEDISMALSRSTSIQCDFATEFF